MDSHLIKSLPEDLRNKILYDLRSKSNFFVLPNEIIYQIIKFMDYRTYNSFLQAYYYNFKYIGYQKQYLRQNIRVPLNKLNIKQFIIYIYNIIDIDEGFIFKSQLEIKSRYKTQLIWNIAVQMRNDKYSKLLYIPIYKYDVKDTEYLRSLGLLRSFKNPISKREVHFNGPSYYHYKSLMKTEPLTLEEIINKYYIRTIEEDS